MNVDPVSAWFEAQGVSPVVGGALLGGALVYLLLRGRSKPPVRVELPRPPSPQGVSSADVQAQALDLVRQKKKIEAVKLVKQREGLGLKEAKELVEQWVRDEEASGRI